MQCGQEQRNNKLTTIKVMQRRCNAIRASVSGHRERDTIYTPETPIKKHSCNNPRSATASRPGLKKRGSCQRDMSPPLPLPPPHLFASSSILAPATAAWRGQLLQRHALLPPAGTRPPTPHPPPESPRQLLLARQVDDHARADLLLADLLRQRRLQLRAGAVQKALEEVLSRGVHQLVLDVRRLGGPAVGRVGRWWWCGCRLRIVRLRARGVDCRVAQNWYKEPAGAAAGRRAHIQNQSAASNNPLRSPVDKHDL